MKARLLLAVLTLAACEQPRPRDFGPPRTIADAGAARDGGSGADGSTIDAGFDPDGGAIDAGVMDAGSGRDGGGARDAGPTPGRDAGFPRDAGFSRDAGFRDAGPPAGTVGLAFTGCSADFSGEIVVSYNGSIAIGSITNHVLTASVQFDLNGTGTKRLSTQHRIDTGEVVNLVTQGTTWTNISSRTPDPIGGTLIVRQYAPSSGRIDVDFVGVTLEDVQSGSVCRIDGTAVATRLHP